ncbi:adherin [Schizosaccharomyces japonicus yFS275]|uniref:Sister chromatid cohesion protein n=1 Tax=Schizosaccharomyces japonicus (strain yFS275 / FY16936) TaxID=402676 RepID=B6JWL8_SCHJY|nr:adherin [Schizosaccharomyces japonicus yFS275]EEB05769.2 adherin [Schizosaccharomyces japonicus yFS275]
MSTHVKDDENASFDVFSAFKFTPLTTGIPISLGTNVALTPSSRIPNEPLELNKSEMEQMTRYLDHLNCKNESSLNPEESKFYEESLRTILKEDDLENQTIKLIGTNSQRPTLQQKSSALFIPPILQSLSPPCNVQLETPLRSTPSLSSDTNVSFDVSLLSSPSRTSENIVERNTHVKDEPLNQPSNVSALHKQNDAPQLHRLEDDISRQKEELDSLLSTLSTGFHLEPQKIPREMRPFFFVYPDTMGLSLSNFALDRLILSFNRLQQITKLESVVTENAMADLKSFSEAGLRAWKPPHFMPLQNVDEIMDALESLEHILKLIYFIVFILSYFPTYVKLHDETTLSLILEKTYSIGEVFISQALQFYSVDGVQKNPSLKPKFSMVFGKYSDTLMMIAKLSELIPFSEAIIVRTVFLSVFLVTLEAPAKENTVTIPANAADVIQSSAFECLQLIFSTYPSHREFVLQEALMSLTTLPASRSLLRTYRLSSRKQVLPISTLLVKLIQSTSFEINRFLEDLNVPVETVEKYESMKNYSKLIESIDSRLLKSRELEYKFANLAVSFFLNRAMQQAKSDTNTFMSALTHAIVEDLLNMLTLPEWPSVETLVRQFAFNLVIIILNERQTVAVRRSALELLSIIVNKLNETFSVKLYEKYGFQPFDNKDSEKPLTEDLLNQIEKIANVCIAYQYELSFRSSCYRYNFMYSRNLWLLYFLSLKPNTRDEVVKKQLITFILRYSASNGMNVFNSPNDEQLNDFYLLSLYGSSLYQSLQSFISLIIGFIDSPQANLRTKSLRILNHMNDLPKILRTQPVLLNQVIGKLNDNSAVARELAVDLLGSYILSNPDALPSIYEVISLRTSDVSTAVRKRALKNLRDFHNLTQDKAIHNDIYLKLLLRRTDQEESITVLSLKILEDLWFGSIPLQEGFGDLTFDDLSVVSKTTLNAHCRFITNFFAETTGDIQLRIVASIKQMLASSTDEGRIELEFRLSMLLGSLFSRLMENLYVVDSESASKQVREILATLYLFSRSTPSLFTESQVTLLKSYLKGASNLEEQRMCFYVVALLRQILPYQPSIPVSFLREVETVLLQLLPKAGTFILRELVPCLCYLFEKLSDHQRLQKILKSCLTNLGTIPVDTKPEKVSRILDLLGLFVKFGDFTDACFNPSNLLLTAIKDSSIYLYLSNVFLKYLSSKNSHTVDSAMECLMNVCLASPSLFVSERVVQVLDTIFKNLDKKKIFTFFAALREILSIDQDIIREADAKLNSKNNKNKQVDLDVAVFKGHYDNMQNEGVTTCLSQRYLSYILQFTLSEDTSLSSQAFDILKSVVQQGLINPRMCFPTLLALEESPQPLYRDMAMNLHLELIQKHESLLEGLYIEGVMSLYKYRNLNNPSSLLLYKHSPLQNIYTIVARSKGTKSRKRFICRIAKMLELDSTHLVETSAHQAEFYTFICYALALLEYMAYDEVLTIIHYANAMLATNGPFIIQWLQTVGEDTVSKQANAIMLSNVILLKRYLTSTYAISETRIQNFDISKSFRDIKLPPRNQTLLPSFCVVGEEYATLYKKCIQLFEEENIANVVPVDDEQPSNKRKSAYSHSATIPDHLDAMDISEASPAKLRKL